MHAAAGELGRHVIELRHGGRERQGDGGHDRDAQGAAWEGAARGRRDGGRTVPRVRPGRDAGGHKLVFDGATTAINPTVLRSVGLRRPRLQPSTSRLVTYTTAAAAPSTPTVTGETPPSSSLRSSSQGTWNGANLALVDVLDRYPPAQVSWKLESAIETSDKLNWFVEK